MSVFPDRLVPGDQIRCVAPARNATLPWVGAVLQAAVDRLAREGFRATFGAHVTQAGPLDSSPVSSRLADLHAAFGDPEVKAILSLIGGFNSNQLLRYLDYDLVRANPKIVCGYSDITALITAIHARTGLVTYHGPHLFNFGDLRGADYTVHGFRQCVTERSPYDVAPCGQWSADLWAADQVNRTFHANGGPYAVRPGQATGRSLGGNLRTFMQLAGTPFWPGLDGAVVFLEDYDRVTPPVLDALLESLISQRDFDGVRGLAFGRFHPASGLDTDTLRALLLAKDGLRHLPLVIDLDFGHTHPTFTFPVGGRVRFEGSKDGVVLTVLEH